MSRKICVISGSRAEYGLLQGLLKKLEQSSKIDLQLIVTGSHLSSEFGYTLKEIQPSFSKFEKVEILLSSDTHVGMCKSMGLALISLSETLDRLKPDLILVLGDRYEILAAVTAANALNYPIAHLHGGEITKGALDDAFRHAITKMSHLHFTSTESYQKRVIQMGASPDYVWNVGALGIEQIKTLPLLSKEELSKTLACSLDSKTYLVTYHPETKQSTEVEANFKNLIKALREQKAQVIFTKANSDPQGRIINQLIDELSNEQPEQFKAYASLGSIKYLSLLSQVDAVIGNSSSGIIEAPSFKIPSINIGQRQTGRISASSVLHCDSTFESIQHALREIEGEEFQSHLKNCVNPYEKDHTSDQILEHLLTCDLSQALRQSFHDQP